MTEDSGPDPSVSDNQDVDEKSFLLAEIPNRLATVLWTVSLVFVVVVPAGRLQTQAFVFGEFINAAAIVATFALICAAVVFLVRRSLELALRVALGAAFGFFWWAEIDGAATTIADTVPLISPGVIAVALVTTVCGFLWFRGQLWVVGGSIALLISIAGVTNVAKLADLTVENQPWHSVVSSVAPGPDSPNVVVLVLDGRGRTDSMKASFGYDDSAFIGELSAQGFLVNSAGWSNHNRTYASIASMLALESIATDQVEPSSVWPRTRGVLGGEGELLRSFADAGYQVVFSPAAWGGSWCGAIVDRCAEIGRTRTNLYWLLRGTVLAPIVPKVMLHPWTDRSIKQLEGLGDLHTETMMSGQRTVTWMHVVLPHPPLHLDSSCEVHTDSWRDLFDLPADVGLHDRYADAFSEQLECVDRMVAEATADIVAMDPDAVVVVVSDHGPDGSNQPRIPISSYTDEQVWEKLAILIAVRGGARCQAAAEEASTISVMRSLVECSIGASTPGQADRYYLVPAEPVMLEGVSPIEVSVSNLPSPNDG